MLIMFPRTKHDMSDAVFLYKNEFGRNGRGFVSITFETDMPYHEMLDYFDKEMKNNGWQYEKTEIVKYMFADTGERFMRYGKMEYNAGVVYREADKGKAKFTLFISNHPE